MKFHILGAVLCFILFSTAVPHSFLLIPRGDFVSFRKPECRLGGPPHAPNDTCPGPCIAKDRWQFDSHANTTVFKRGQNVTIVWPRNNHEGGFVRFTLVPVSDRMSHEAHKRMVFHYACFESDRVPCSYPYCGTDGKNTVFQTSVIIPSVYPDGLYVLGWAWFGGIMNRVSYFGDYWSCSFIRIQGGAPVQLNYQPVFIPGKKNHGANGVGESSCRSSVDNVGVCVREPCIGRTPSFTVPASFANGSVPSPIYAYWLYSQNPLMSAEASAGLTPSSALTPTASSLVSPIASPSSYLSESPLPSVLPSPTAATSPLASSPKPKPTKSSVAVSSTKNSNQGANKGPENPTRKVLISAVKMLDTKSNATLATGQFGTLSLSETQLQRITFVAETTGYTSSVSFFLDGRFVRTERRAPYSCFGDRHGKFRPWSEPILDRWVELTVRAYSPDNFMNPQHIWFRLYRTKE